MPLSFDLIIMINSVCAYYGASLEPLLKGISRLLKPIEKLIDAPQYNVILASASSIALSCLTLCNQI